jgi:selenocysteine lyase/cysteine desulfurase
MLFKIDTIRKQFPALADEWVFLDNSGGTQVTQQAVWIDTFSRVFTYWQVLTCSPTQSLNKKTRSSYV